ncbi:MAG TPA: methyltransferase domain-containing protein [Verrucomicrobiae bacterium]|nr:methyltransferase domain-containing protein [Verrucomicrobiae bacterium]
MTAASILKLMQCPSCGGELDKKKTNLVCKGCDASFSIEDDMPIMMDTRKPWGKSADKDRITYNGFYADRIAQGDGWWVKKTDPYLRMRDEHNLNASRWFVCNLIHKQNPDAKVILDAGGGEGYVSNYLLDLYGEKKAPMTICYDLSNTLLADGAERYDQPTLVPIAGDLQHLALKDNSIDCILCIETVEHIRDLSSYAKEILRVLKPGGKIYITTPNKSGSQLWINDRGIYFVHNFVQIVANVFRKNKVTIEPVPFYGHYEGEDGYEHYQTPGSLSKYFKDAGFAVAKQYFVQWAGEASFMVSKFLHLPLFVPRLRQAVSQPFEVLLRTTPIGKAIGFTQIAVFSKPDPKR